MDLICMLLMLVFGVLAVTMIADLEPGLAAMFAVLAIFSVIGFFSLRNQTPVIIKTTCISDSFTSQGIVFSEPVKITKIVEHKPFCLFDDTSYKIDINPGKEEFIKIE